MTIVMTALSNLFAAALVQLNMAMPLTSQDPTAQDVTPIDLTVPPEPEMPADVPSEIPAETAVPMPQIVATAAPATGQLAFAGMTDAEVFTRAIDTLEKINTLKARFVQIAPSGDESTGTINLDRPGKLRFDYDKPSDQLIVAAGGLVYVHDAALETTDSYPVGKTPLKFLLSKRIDREDAAVEDVFRTPEGVAILLTATDEEIPGKLALVFSAPDFELQEWVVIQPNGATTQVALSDVEYGARLPGRLFRVPDSGGSFLRDR